MEGNFQNFKNRFALWSVGIGVILSIIVVGVASLNLNGEIPVLSQVSVGSISAVLTLITAFFIVLFGYRRKYLFENKEIQGFVYYFNSAALAIIISIASALLMLTLFVVISNAFEGALLSFPTAVIATSLFVGFGAYTIAKASLGINGKLIIDIMLAVLSIGLLLAMLSSDNPEWWKNSLSYLGHDFGSNSLFNATLISVGVLILVMSNILMDGFYALVEEGKMTMKKYNRTYYFLAVAAILIAGVGVFPTTVTPFSDFMHNFCIHVLSVVLVLGMFYVTKFLDFMPNEYKSFSILMGILSISLFVMSFIFDMISFVSFEVCIFLIFGIWAKITVENAYAFIDKK